MKIYGFIGEQSSDRAVGSLCRVLGVSRSAYYHHRAHPVSRRQQADSALLDRITDIHQASRGVYGSPRVHAALKTEGIRCGRKRVARLMRQHHLRAKTVRRFRVTTRPSHSRRQWIDLIQRRFDIGQANRVWTSDITYLLTAQGWMYLAVVLDLSSRRVVGWELSTRLTTELVTMALQRALETREVAAGLVLHSDRGTQYTSQELGLMVREHGIRQSHGLSCYDNAVTESFFHTLKTEHLQFEHFETKDQVRASLFDYIEVFYNRQRKHSTLGMISPEQYEKLKEST
jgi:putative transposase